MKQVRADELQKEFYEKAHKFVVDLASKKCVELDLPAGDWTPQQENYAHRIAQRASEMLMVFILNNSGPPRDGEEERRILTNHRLAGQGIDVEDGFSWNGMWIIDPWYDEQMVRRVFPWEYYGKAYEDWRNKG